MVTIFLITDSIKVLLGRHTKILVKYMVKLEIKTDKTENRVLVSSIDVLANCNFLNKRISQ